MTDTQFLLEANNSGFSLNSCTGIFSQKFQGVAWHEYAFEITFPRGFEVKSATVLLSMADIENHKLANWQRYIIPLPAVKCSGNTVFVTGKLHVGDSDGFLNALSYFCLAAGSWE